MVLVLEGVCVSRGGDGMGEGEGFLEVSNGGFTGDNDPFLRGLPCVERIEGREEGERLKMRGKER